MNSSDLRPRKRRSALFGPPHRLRDGMARGPEGGEIRIFGYADSVDNMGDDVTLLGRGGRPLAEKRGNCCLRLFDGGPISPEGVGALILRHGSLSPFSLEGSDQSDHHVTPPTSWPARSPSARPHGNEGHPGFFRLNVQAGHPLWRLQYHGAVSLVAETPHRHTSEGALETDRSDPEWAVRRHAGVSLGRWCRSPNRTGADHIVRSITDRTMSREFHRLGRGRCVVAPRPKGPVQHAWAVTDHWRVCSARLSADPPDPPDQDC